ncbi:uncharacterized protein LOC123471144 isoform X1 [Daphnia magna]|uniref:uncharacterized protein LOC123471144 isoform X1 n=1 Tax=Daphnia magna TaxID=35525 RepID=UPI001E1BB2AB|nr:uncharacterized protein LOC123471144 isoform X1 [Daphnia magna]XP_045028019.1 uncharacterized protein LOC123471144 isoform X1 [Daphnia magna]XP_045028020.1 uncharacterized protein LOC123471144 isoform X1 [Daphnia magna]
MSSPVSSSFTGNINGIQFDRQDFFGKGGSDSVQSGTFNGQRVAIKRIELTKGTDQSYGKEFETLQQLEHPNVVRLLQCGNDNNFRYYAFEWCGASLDQLFLKADDTRKYNGPMPHHIDISLQLASGLEHIHSRNLVHGNIKPENVLISAGSAGQDEITLKWANSGLTRYASKREKITSQVGGNNAWLAPELLLLKLGGNLHRNKYQGTVKSDIFAQGLIFGSLFLNGEHLYGTMENEDEITENITNGNPINMQKMNRILRDCYEDEIFKRILENDPNKRMTSTAVVNQLKTIKDKISGKEKELLQLCARDSRLDLSLKIKNFIPFGININVKDNDGSNALHLLCRYYSRYELIAAINLVIQSGIDVNARDYNGLNALHYVCRYNSSRIIIDAIQNLIKLGIDPKAKTKDGSNALHYLTRYNSKSDLNSVIKILENSGVDLWEEDDYGWNMFYYLDIKNKKKMEIWFDRKAFLGRGGFGHVFKGKYGGREVAVKRVELHLVNETEEKALLALHHPNVVKLLHCDSDEDFRMYVLELCDASLDQLFLEPNDPKKYDGPMPRYIQVFLQLALGLEHIHSKKLIHRDIKPQNVLISKTSSSQRNEVTIKWADFGLSKSVDEEGYHSWSEVRGTRTWYAPEVLKISLTPKEAKEVKGSVKSDVFSQGLVFGFLFLKGQHVYGLNENEIRDNVIEKKTINMKKIDGELLEIYEHNLLQKMLEDEPGKRMTSTEVVQQLKSIEKKLAEKEEQLRQLCASRQPRSDLTREIQNLICFGIDVNATNQFGFNAFHLLCQHNSGPYLIEAIKVLIELGIDLNAKNKDGWNALHVLCRYNSTPQLNEAIKVLIELGIDLNAKTNSGWNALHVLCYNNSGPHLIEAIKVLIDFGIDLNANDNDGWSALHRLCYENSGPHLIEAIKVLIELGIDLNAKKNDGWNALHLLCRNNSTPQLIEAIKVLIELGIDLNAKQKYGLNALHLLCYNNSTPHLIEAIKVLIDLGIEGLPTLFQSCTRREKVGKTEKIRNLRNFKKNKKILGNREKSGKIRKNGKS